LDVLLQGKAEGFTFAEIESRSELGGWRETLRRLKQRDADWDSAILFPDQRYGRYRIANAAE
jgi:hypothetical protein